MDTKSIHTDSEHFNDLVRALVAEGRMSQFYKMSYEDSCAGVRNTLINYLCRY